MVPHLRLLCALVLLSSALPAFAQEPVILRHRIVKDVPIKQEISTETTQHMKVAGSDIKNAWKQTYYFSTTPIELDMNGNWIVKQKIEGIKMNSEISGSPPITYDSTKPGAANTPLAEFLKVLVGAEFKITIDDDMKVIKVEGREEFIEKLNGANPQMAPLLKLILSEAGSGEMANPFLITFPTGAVKAGDRWKRSRVIDLGPLGRVVETREYTYRGEGKDKLKRIDVLSRGEYAKPDPAVASGLPFTIANADFTYPDSGGVIKFDNRDGRVVSAELTFQMRGTMTFTIAGNNTNVEVATTQKTTLKTSAPDLPAAEIAPELVQPSPAPAVACYEPCRCRAHRLFHRFRRCR